MTAVTPAAEKTTVALPLTILETYIMGIVFTINAHGERTKMKAAAFLCVPLGFLSFADHARIHNDYFSFHAWVGLNNRACPLKACSFCQTNIELRL
jgi:hypothetical protein